MTVKEAKTILDKAYEYLYVQEDAITLDRKIPDQLADIFTALNREIPAEADIITNEIVYKCPKCHETVNKNQARCYNCLQVLRW